MQSQRPPLFAILFISLFGFIGLTVLIFLWSQDSAPLFFKIFGSFVALGFIFMGFGAPISMLKLRAKAIEEVPLSQNPSGYKCPGCGAGIGTEEVSPSGDVKCSYCKRWYNIHTKQA